MLGKSPEEHDLSLLEEPLRSHGGLSEQTVPFVINCALDAASARRLADAALTCLDRREMGRSLGTEPEELVLAVRARMLHELLSEAFPLLTDPSESRSR